MVFGNLLVLSLLKICQEFCLVGFFLVLLLRIFHQLFELSILLLGRGLVYSRHKQLHQRYLKGLEIPNQPNVD